MKIEMVCSTWVREDDEKVLQTLEASDRWLTTEEIADLTGLSHSRIEHTLRLLVQQMELYEARKRFLSE